MKRCKACKTCKELTEFDSYVTMKGLSYRCTCRKCRNDKNLKTYYSKEENVIKQRDRKREYVKYKRLNSEYLKKYMDCLSELRKIIRKIKSGKDVSPYVYNFYIHIQSQFRDGMTWDNYGSLWEFDHIISATRLAKLGYSVAEINKIGNLRPLLVVENRGRSRKLPEEYKPNNPYKKIN